MKKTMLSVVSVLLLIITHNRGGIHAHSPFWGIPGPVLVYQRPIDAMVDVTNDLGIAVLQDFAYTRSNFAFSPYGVASVLVVLYEGARGESARQIHNTLSLPWNRDITRIGFRDIHRHLRSYFSYEGYLSGLALNKNQTSLLVEYRRVLRFYGYDVGTGQGDQFPPTTTTKKPTTTTTTSTAEPTTTTNKPTTTTTTSTTEPTTTVSTTENMESTPIVSTENMDITTMDPRNMITEEQTTTEAATSPPEVPETTTEAATFPPEVPETTTEAATSPPEVPETTTEAATFPPEVPETTTEAATSPEVPETTTEAATSPPEVPETTTEAATFPPEVPETTTEAATSPEVPETTTEAATSPSEMPETTAEAATSTPQEVPETTTEDVIPPTKTTEDIIPPVTTTRTTTEESVTLITLTIPRETTPRPVADEPITEQSSRPPMQDEESTVQPEVTPTSVPETTEISTKEMPADTTVSIEKTPAPTEPSEILMEPTELPEVLMEPTQEQNMSTESPDKTSTGTPDGAIASETPVADEGTTESPVLADEPIIPTVADLPIIPTEVPEVEIFLPTEVPEEIMTVGPTEPEAEIIATTKTVEPSTESTNSETEMTPTEGSTIEMTGGTSTSEVDTTVSTSSPDIENTIPDGLTDTLAAATTSEFAETETLTGSMSEIIESKDELNMPIPLVYNQSETTIDRNKRSISDGVVVFPDISLQLQNGMFDSQVARGSELYTQLPKRPFLMDGVAEELVPVMSYTAMFPFAYIRRLHAQALEFPLDDERYKLLLVLPVERRGLRQLIYDMSSCPLREIYEAMRPTRVQAIIPSFMVEGFVILTPTLQQLGIWDVFDPRRANLSGMSNDPDLYVRNIEQAVTVVIRNYVKILDIQTRTMAARATLERFVVAHPFLYFVMDTETRVALMAGKIVDPMNSRIY